VAARSLLDGGSPVVVMLAVMPTRPTGRGTPAARAVQTRARTPTALACDNALTRAGAVERVTGIEPVGSRH
jgi:hypothetical protein